MLYLHEQGTLYLHIGVKFDAYFEFLQKQSLFKLHRK